MLDDTPDDLRTDELIVTRNGKLLFEHYDGVFDHGKPHSLWSASKTVTATLLGAAIEARLKTPDGKSIILDTMLPQFYAASERKKPLVPDITPLSSVRLRHLVEMTAGFAWQESYEGDVETSTILQMLYLDDQRDMPSFALNRPIVFQPGSRWLYSGGNANLIMGALRRAAGADVSDLPWRLLFEPLGIAEEVVFECDGAGNFVGSSYVHLTPRAMARLGELYLHDGIWQGQRILPPGWVQDAKALNPAQLSTDYGPGYDAYVRSEGPYGKRGFWLNLPMRGMEKPFPDAPADMFFAAGHYGQLIIILPSQNMMLARTGHDAGYWSSINTLVAKALACFAP